MMHVIVHRVINNGRGIGTEVGAESPRVVEFIGPKLYMQNLAKAVLEAEEAGEELPRIYLEAWQII